MPTYRGFAKILNGNIDLITQNCTIKISAHKNKLHIIDGDFIEYDDELNVVKTLAKYSCGIPGILNISSKTSYGSTKSGGIKKKFYPYDKKYPPMIVSTKHKYQPIDVYVVVKFEKWENNVPIGTILKYIGSISDFDSEYYEQICLSEWNKNNKNSVTINDINSVSETSRENYINEEVYSIDPPNCKDIDDALHFKKTNFGFEIGIHIADVSNFIIANSPIDTEIKNRIESVYFNDKQFNMLPDALSTDKLSLLEGKERCCFSCVIRVNNDYDIVSYNFVKSLIKVTKNLSYDGASDIITNDASDTLSNLYKAAKQIYDKKYGIDVAYYDTHKMVEYYMIIANNLAAEFILNNKKNCIVRTQSKSDDIHIIGNVPEHIKNIIKIHNLEKAEYGQCSSVNDNLLHHSLGIKYYTHFTSPIRRYVDIVIHRIVSDILTNNDSQRIDNYLVNKVNSCHNKYKKYTNLSKQLSILDSILTTDNNSFIGYVVSIDNNYIGIYIDDINMSVYTNVVSEKLINLLSVKLEDNKLILEGKITITFQIGDMVSINIVRVKNDIKRKIYVKFNSIDINSLF